MEYKISKGLAELISEYYDDEILQGSDRYYHTPERNYARLYAWDKWGRGMNWQEWKGLEVHECLASMPVFIDPRMKLAGCPLLHIPTEEQTAELETLAEKCSDMTPFPGGDGGHIHPDYDKIFRLGIKGFEEHVQSYIRPGIGREKESFYRSCLSALSGMRIYIKNCGDKCRETAETAEGEEKKNLLNLANICYNLYEDAPKTFHEAVQLMTFVIYALIFGEGHVQTTPGRIDRTLLSFYERDLKEGRINKKEAFELISHLYYHLNYQQGPWGAVSVIVGGRDREGNTVENDLTWLAIEARIKTHMVYPTVGLAWTEDISDKMMTYAAKTITKGVGCPAIFNDYVISDGLKNAGVAPEDSIYWMNSTCVELKPAGCSNIWVASPYFNCSMHLLNVMKDIKEGKSQAEGLDDMNRLLEASLKKEVGEQAKCHDDIWNRRKEYGLFPFLSCFIDDCLEKGLDYDNGGARYNWVECSFVGLANISDALYVLDRLVFREKRYTIGELYDILEKNFEGYEELLAEIANMPKYGNDIDEVDDIAKYWFTKVADISHSFNIGGHAYEPGTFCWQMHEYLGRETGATPDGRLAGTAFADGSGSAQGRDVNGPTSSILSTTKWDHSLMVGGMVQNIRFNKSSFTREADYKALKDLIVTYLKRGGFEIQVNMTSKEELLDAQIHPEKYKDLVVRVAGYSDYFTHLNPNMQAEVISRTEHIF